MIKVAGAYLLGMWIVLQVAETTFEPLRLPEWWMTALTILAVMGLPIVAALAWSYEITPGGIVPDEDRPGGVRLPRARRAVAPALVAGVSLMALVTGYAWWRTIEQPATADEPPERLAPSPQSIAVLPFVDMSPGGEAAYLGDGLSEELSSDLAKLPGLRVAARTSAFAFKGRDMDVRRIGEQLGVRFVLEGSVRREGERVRVTAQLIDASTGFHAWTDSYNRPWQDLIGIQQEISGAIAQRLHMVISPELAQQLKAAPTRDPRAYDFYLAGLAQLRQGASMKGIGEAESLFRRSLEADPDFARAQAGLCQVAILRYERTSAAEHVVEAEAACRAALEADATLKETELALGRLYFTSGRHEQAEAVFRSLLRALAARRRSLHRPRSHAGALESPQGGRAELPRGDHRRARLLDGLQRARRVPVRRRPQPRSCGCVPARDRARAREPHRPQQPRRRAAVGRRPAGLGAGVREVDAGRAVARGLLEPRHPVLLPRTGSRNRWRCTRRASSSRRRTTGCGAGAPTRGGRCRRSRDAAREDYRRAIALAEKSLEVDATDAEAWAQLGYYYGRLGDVERANRYLARGMELGPDAPFVFYCAAIAAVDRGDRQEAQRLINEAIAKGFSPALARPDPALRGIPIA